MTTFREWRRDNSGTLADYENWQRVTRLGPLKAGVESVTAAVAGKVFYSEDGKEALVLLDSDPYVVRIDAEGDTTSAYLVTVPPAEITAVSSMAVDEADIAGWSTGWTC